MTNGNDILEFEQANAERLKKEYSEMVNEPVEDLDFSSNNCEYWGFVENEYSQAYVIMEGQLMSGALQVYSWLLGFLLVATIAAAIKMWFVG